MRVWIHFVPNHRNDDVFWMLSDVMPSIYFPNELLVAGTTVDEEVWGDSYISQGGFSFATAGLTADSVVEVLEVAEPDPECTPFRSIETKLRFDLYWEGAEGWYDFEGEDWVSLFYPDPCED